MSWVLLYFAAGEDSKGRRYFDSPAGEEKYHTTRTGHVMTETPPRRTKAQRKIHIQMNVYFSL
jgi:hypothetical protein